MIYLVLCLNTLTLPFMHADTHFKLQFLNQFYNFHKVEFPSHNFYSFIET